jgi:methionine-rich copper-binding protein CopC
MILAEGAPRDRVIAGLGTITGTIRDINAGVRIVTPLEGAIIRPGQQVPVTVSMNPEAVGELNRIEVGLFVGNVMLGNAVINNPQASNQVMLHLPNASPEVGLGRISAWGTQGVRNVTGERGSINVIIQRIYAGVRIVTPQGGANIKPGQQLSVTVSMNREAVGVQNRINVYLQAADRFIANAVINNPQTSNQVMLQVPANAAAGAGIIRAENAPLEGSYTDDDNINVIIQKINTGLRITRPQDDETVRPGETIAVETALNQEAIGVVPSIGVTLQSAGAFIQDAARTINNPGISSRTTTRIPDTLRPGTQVVLGAIVSAPGRNISDFCSDNGRSERYLRVGKVPAGLKVTNPRDGAKVLIGQDINVAISMEKSAPRFIERIAVSLLKNDAPVAAAQVQRPTMTSQAILRMPDGIRPGDRLKVRAVAEPNDILENFQDESNITIEKPKANLRIAAPRNNEKIKKGRMPFDVAVSMDRSCENIAKTLVVAVMSGSETIAEKRISNPRADTSVTINFPKELKSGAYQVKVTVLPEADILSNSDSINLTVE